MNYTSYQGTVYATLSELNACLGTPLDAYDPGKSRVEWAGDTHGVAFTVYDWKRPEPLDELDEWNVGGHDQRAVRVVELLLERHRALA